MQPLRIGTRSSPLALWQANHVADQIRRLADARPIQFVPIQTRGDRDAAASLTQIGGQGVFTKEIQRALLDGRVDLAVHSLKDLPTEPTRDLVIAAVPPRGPICDVLVSRDKILFHDLRQGARVATGSIRRRAQMLHRRPDLECVDIRGNVETRLAKLESEGFDALVLAEAGLMRLDRSDAISEVLDPAWMLPAIGQGALAVECRENDSATRELLAPLDDRSTRAAITAERALLFHLGGGCQAPIGATADVVGAELSMRGAVLAPDGSQRISGDIRGPIGHAAALGEQLADQLRSRGADRFLALS
jgi:hydroxymethylbilane synthase